MVVIQGIKTAIKIAPIIYKVGQVAYKGFKSTRKGQQWLSRHPNVAKYGTVGIGVGGLILDLTNIDYSAIIPKNPGYPKNGQTRSNFYSTQRGRFRRYNNCYRPRRRRRS